MNHEEMYGKGNRGEYVWSDVLFVDPGTQRTGLAYWKVLDPNDVKPPSTTELLKASARGWEERTDDVITGFSQFLDRLYVDLVVIEWPRLWSGSAKSQAAGEKESITKLACLIGDLRGSAREYGRDIMLVPVNDWKGQLKKPMVDERIADAISKAYEADVSDAVGMGLSAVGAL